jgi:hypothetical protein
MSISRLNMIDFPSPNLAVTKLLLAFHALILTILNHKLFYPGQVKGCLDD